MCTESSRALPRLGQDSSLVARMSMTAEDKTLLDLDDDLLSAVAKELAESALASAVALKRCSSRFKDLAAPLVADAVAMTNEKWRDAAAKIGGQIEAIITGALDRNEVLKTLELYDIGNEIGNEISDDGAKALASALRINAVLTNLDIAYNDIGPGGAEAITEALTGNGVLTSLNMGNNEIGPTGATAIAKALRGNGMLKTLNLYNNQIRAEGAAAIAEALRGNEVLTSLDLSGNEICGLDYMGRGAYSAAGIAALAEALKVNEVLTDLNLSGNNIGGETGYIKASEVEGESKEVGAKVIYQGREINVSKGVDSDGELKLSDVTGVLAIADALKVNGVLTNLELRWNSIGDEGAKVIGKALAVNGVLTELDLSSNGIDNAGAEALASALCVNAVLTTLNLRGNCFGDEGVKALAAAFRVNGGADRVGPVRSNSLGGARRGRGGMRFEMR